MNFFISARAELIKIKRSASLWICFLGAGFIPLIFLLNYTLQPEKNFKRLAMFPWAIHFGIGWQAFSSFLLPMFIILICSLIPQIEFKNNTWKQVFASPQPLANIFISAVGIGLALLIASIIAIPFWDYAYTLPYAHPMLTMQNFTSKTNQVALPKHEVYSVFYFIGFALLAFLDMKYRKERG